MKKLITIITILLSLNSYSQIQVKILKINTKDSLTRVKMKTIKRPRVILWTECKCVVPYKKKDIVWIRKDF